MRERYNNISLWVINSYSNSTTTKYTLYIRSVLNLHHSKSRKTIDVEMKRLNALTEKNNCNLF